MGLSLARHDGNLRDAIADAGGYIFLTGGDSSDALCTFVHLLRLSLRTHASQFA